MEQEQTPQLTFTEKDCAMLVDFFNLIANKATLNLTLRETSQLSQLMAEFKRHIDKVEAHIFEIKKITRPVQKAEKKG